MIRILRKTKSVCPICIEYIDAEIIEENNKIFMEKECRKHGKFKVLLSDDALYYKELNILDSKIKIPKLDIDSLVLLFLTQNCNLNCPICYIRTKEKYKGPQLKDIKVVLKKFKNTEIALFGGEPTLRKDLVDITKEIIKSGNIPLLVTNGIRLADFRYLKLLKKSGIEIVLLQFDGFEEEIYKKLRGKNLLGIKKKALQNLKRLDMSTSLEVAVGKGINDKKIIKIFDFAVNNPFIKQICFRSYGFLGNKKIEYKKMLTVDQIISRLENETNGKISKKGIIQFQKLVYSLKEIFSFIPIDLCLYAQNYLIFRDKGKFQTPSDIINFNRLDKHLNRYINLKRRKKIDKLKFLIRIIANINCKRVTLLLKIFLPILFKKIIGKRTCLKEMPGELLILRFSLMCEPYRFDYNVAEKCKGYEIRNNKVYKSRAICNILREKAERIK